MIILTILVVVMLTVLSYKENGIKTYSIYETSSIRGFHLTHKENDDIKWELSAKNATFPEGSREVILEDLKMMIHHKLEMQLTGGSGVYNIQEKNLTINEPLEVDIKGAKLTTDSLTWNGKDGLITARNGITFKGRNFQIDGKGLNAEVKHQQIRILEDVKGVFYR